MFSLCIPTMNRFDTFLKNNLKLYLKNELIDEIIISDENGNDVNCINQYFGENTKIKCYVNKKRLGPFLNKITCCKLAKNEWIVLIDSDNFADENYFKTGKEFIFKNISTIKKNSILAPSFAMPNFNYTHLNGLCLKKNTINLLKNEKNNMKPHHCSSDTLMNTGNYILNKYLIDNINLSKDIDLIQNSSACDVILFNTMLFEQLNLEMYIVENLHYSHMVHRGSIYTQTCALTKNYINIVHQRYFSLKNTI